MQLKVVIYEEELCRGLDKHIRRIFYKGEWYFSITDIIGVLTNSSNSRRYWSDLKIQLSKNEGFTQLYEKIVQLKLESSYSHAYTARR